MLENENMIDFIGSLKEMPSEQLSRLIQEETAKEYPNDELVLMALGILENREKEKPIVLGSKEKAAWKKYQSKVLSRNRIPVLTWKPLMQVASVMLVISLLFALLPTKANAETWWERLARWTDDFFSFLNPNVYERPEDEYVFQTDNEGLQQVYNAVVEMGITEQIVPMWIPNEYNLVEFKISSFPKQDFLFACFSNGSSEFVYQINVFHSESNVEYFKDNSTVDTIERAGKIYNILRNENRWTVVCIVDNIEYSFAIDCQEDILHEIIESIYRWRDNYEAVS